ncbi:MAG: hypothetical protein HRT97_02875 [Moritella sp.]|uniref:hypothetical protein n=1 Tax=Moritella sp. TaxID=78556 RepID=UPI0025DAD59B|nr:hypothetical protein [Moritella sp.]NQZ91270.1 hypothetical protein [Moritella sp.]
MTAEVAIFNKSAIALAADSAVSIESISSSKIYNNAEKLFALTKYHPVALMIYESNELQGVPWELIIKSYRKHLGESSFNTLEEYKSDFLSFTEAFYIKLPFAHIKNSSNEYFHSLTIQTLERVEELINDDYESEIEILEAIDSAVSMLLERYEKLPYFEGLDEHSIENASIDFEEFAIEIFNSDVDISKFPEETVNLWSNASRSFYTLCKLRALKQDPFFYITTGLVFAGYGEEEYFPVILECEVFGMLNNTLKVISAPCFTDGRISGLKAFAQKEEVDTFMKGVCTPTLENFFHNFTSVYSFSCDTISDLIDKYVPDDLKNEVKEKYTTDLTNHTDQCYEDINQHTQEKHVDKVVKMIAHLPKNEMAYMAESLVNLTAFKRKVSSERDSVGGPIDVAVISKTDGFVWIKRKHYFPKELNTDYGPKRTR